MDDEKESADMVESVCMQCGESFLAAKAPYGSCYCCDDCRADADREWSREWEHQESS